MFYDRKARRVEGIETPRNLYILLFNQFDFMELRDIRPLTAWDVENIELWDEPTQTYLGEWEKGHFDYSRASEAVIVKLDRYFRSRFTRAGRPK